MDRKRKAAALSDSNVAKALHIRQKTTGTQDIDKDIDKCVASCEVKNDHDDPPCLTQPEISKFFRLIRHSSVDSDQKVPDDSSQGGDQSDSDQLSQELSSSESDSSQGKINKGVQQCNLSSNPSSPIGASASVFNFLEDLSFQNESNLLSGDVQPKQQLQYVDKQRSTHSNIQSSAECDDEANINEYLGEQHFKKGLSYYRAGKFEDAKKQWKLAKVYKNRKAYFGLGVLHTVGHGVKKINNEKALKYFIKASDGNNVLSNKASVNVAVKLIKNEETFLKGFELLEKAAQSGLKEAQCELGVLLTEQDRYEEAVKWFEEAAMQQYPPAMYSLGICCENGMGITCDDVEACHLYEKASTLGYGYAHHNLAVFYEHGRGGLLKNKEKAIELYRQSAAEGNELSGLDADRLEKSMCTDVSVKAEPESGMSAIAFDGEMFLSVGDQMMQANGQVIDLGDDICG